MSDSSTVTCRRLVIVDNVHSDGIVIERALASRGWLVERTENAFALTPHELSLADAVLIAPDGDEADAFELLLWLSSLPRRPTVVLITRRADARVLGPEVLASLGIDQVLMWPARLERIEAALEHEPERLVS